MHARVSACVHVCLMPTAASAEHLLGEQCGVGSDTPALGWDRILSLNLYSLPFWLGVLGQITASLSLSFPGCLKESSGGPSRD